MQRSSCDLGVTVGVAQLIEGERDSGNSIIAVGKEELNESATDKGVPPFTPDNWVSQELQQRGNGDDTGEEEY